MRDAPEIFRPKHKDGAKPAALRGSKHAAEQALPSGV